MTPDMLPRNFAAKILIDGGTGCWIFTGALNSRGYGCIAVDGDGSTRLAHRASYELLVGPIPAGLTIDHCVCFDKRCVNPAHLEPVTVGENIRRARATGLMGGPVQAQRNAAKSQCKYGHDFSPENTVLDRNGWRVCLACRRGRDRAHRRRVLALMEAAQIVRASS